MPAQDTSEIKEKIISFLKRNGPNLPMRISGEIGSSSLFTSAFLSELLSDKKLKISHMKVGSSPLYFIPGQEHMLEKFAHHLKSKEKETFVLLKEKKFLKDSLQQPAIRVAIRELKDFAIPFKEEEEIIWRFFTIKEDEFSPREKIVEKESLSKPVLISNEEKKEKPLEIFDVPKKEKKPKFRKAKPRQKENKFFSRVKEFLSEKSFDLLDIESFNKNEIVLKVKKDGEEILFFAYNKKRVSERDIIKASKKANETSSRYAISCMGEPLKKIKEFIDASRNLYSIEKIK